MGSYEPNGDILSLTDSVIGPWSYTYDTLNRLTGATAGAGNTAYCGEVGNWQYDAFGNRLQEAYAIANGASCTAASGTSTQMTTTPQSSANNNQIASTIITYDQAGNAYNDGRNLYLYDGEGRLCAVKDGATNYQYLYDASGTRVAKGTFLSWPAVTITNGVATGDLCAAPTSATFTLTNQYLLDLSGDQVTELTGTGAWVHSNAFTGGRLTATYDSAQPGVHYAFADPLGTKRVQYVISSTGTASFEEKCISLPFGNDIGNPRQTNCQGPGVDATEHHFTGKERDTESGNDYFEARYYSSAMGRFMSPDWSAKVEPVPYSKMDDPQSLNLYAYVYNNPLIGVDPTGHAPVHNWDGFQNCSPNSGGADCNGPKKPSDLAVQAAAKQKAQQQSVQQQQQYLNNLASGVRLVPTYDHSPGDNGADRDISYKIVNADGSPYKGPNLWVNEHLDGPGAGGTVKIGNGDYSSASPRSEKNQWNDGLGVGLGTNNIDYKQTFTVSGASGLHPAISAPINVRIGGQDYGTLAVHLGSNHVVSINGYTQFPTSP